MGLVQFLRVYVHLASRRADAHAIDKLISLGFSHKTLNNLHSEFHGAAGANGSDCETKVKYSENKSCVQTNRIEYDYNDEIT